MGMTLVIATGGVDLSVGAIMAISASVAAIMIDPDLQALIPRSGHSVSLPARRRPRDALVATLCGVWNGVLVAYGGIQPMVATLDPDDRRAWDRPAHHRTASACRSSTSRIACLGNGWFVLPLSLFIVAVVFVVAWLLTRRTALGMFIEAVGINAAVQLLRRDQREARSAASPTCLLRLLCGDRRARRQLEHPDVRREQHRAELRARRHPRRRDRRNRARRGRTLLALRQHRRCAGDPGDHHVDVRGRRPGQRACSRSRVSW